ncbi:MAG TPA: hypothetical protein VGO58_02770 [Chitinophagaceae bacterium]|nr:hypothetical protein [Chitinophagaceae bacterium]
MRTKYGSSPIVLQSKIFLMIKEKGGEGMSVDEIDKVLTEYIPRRTLQRRLSEMHQWDWIIKKGEARATRYYLNTAENAALNDNAEDGSARSIQTKEQGRPVSYHRRFLEEYEPQKTSYLSDEDKENLAAIGKTGNPGQPGATYAKLIFPRFLADLTYNSCRLEGNPYSLPEVQQLIKLDDTPGDKTVKETQMIVNHKQAIEFLVFAEEELALNRHTLTNLHAILSDNLLPDPALYGRLRSMPLKPELSVYTPPDNPRLIEEMFGMILEKATQIEDTFEQSFFLMVHLPYLQPFDHVNDQVSRLAMNIPFIKNNLSPVSFAGVSVDSYNKGLSEVYKTNRFALLRDVFIAAYKRSAQLYADFQLPPGDPALFKIKYREQFRKLVSRVVTGAFTREQASVLIKEKSLDIEEKDRPKFIEYADTELLCLHEGNFGRFRIRPEEFKVWKEQVENDPESKG